MRRLIIAFALAAAVMAPVAAGAGPSSQAVTTAQHDCTLLKARMGATAFGQAYSSFGKCVSAYAPVEQNNITAAQSLCSAEQSDTTFASTHGGKTFDQFYGTGKAGKNAFGKCVSAKTQASTQAEQQGRLNPSQTCRAERLANATAFTNTYGKNTNKRNAFGKCVSMKAKAQSTAELAATTSCKTEADDTGFAANHDGKTFAQFYGTNDNDSNAFGKCTSQKARATVAEQEQATISAMKACQAELNAGESAFMQKYGTFGHCVSLKASAK